MLTAFAELLIISLTYVPEWFPRAGFKKLARDWRVAVTAMPKVPFEFVKRSRVSEGLPLFTRTDVLPGGGPSKVIYCLTDA
jgi:hypothetical protein